jgi:hypothetical protein
MFVGILRAQNRGEANRRHAARCNRRIKYDPLFSNAVDIAGLHFAVAVAAEIIMPDFIETNHHDVFFLLHALLRISPLRNIALTYMQLALYDREQYCQAMLAH